MSQWSQVSRIALCMAKVKVSQSVSQLVTRSPIELLWTAKNVSKKTGTLVAKLGSLSDLQLCSVAHSSQHHLLN